MQSKKQSGKYAVVSQDWNDGSKKVIGSSTTKAGALKKLDKYIQDSQFRYIDVHFIKDKTRCAFIPSVWTEILWIEDPQGNIAPLNDNTVKAETINKQANHIINNKNQNTMSNISATKIKSAIKKNGKTTSSVLTTRKNKIGKTVAYMTIPAAFATLPKDATIVQKKRLDVKDVKSGNGFEIYVLACSKKRNYAGFNGQQRTVQNWYVAHKRYFSGKPAFDEILYQGTSKRDAAHRFADIPYNVLEVKLPDGAQVSTQVKVENYTSSTGATYTSRWAVYKSDGSYAAIAANRAQRYQNRQNGNANAWSATNRRRRNG